MNKTDILYVSAVTSAQEFDVMKAARRPGAQEVTYGMIESGYKFHTLIQAGLAARPELRTLSLVGRSLHPAFYRGLFWRRRREVINEGLIVDHLATPNIRVVKQAWLAVTFAVKTLGWRVRTRRSSDRILIVDAAYVSALPGVLLALAGSNVKRIAIFCDVYSYMADVSDANRSVSARARLVSRVVGAAYRKLDGFVLLTEQMNPVVNPAGKPHLVMEGLVDSTMASHPDTWPDKYENPTVLYSGALRREYGLDWLVEGFEALSNPDARLAVYGGGDFAPSVVEASRRDSRISYGGTLPIADVVREQERAWLLVNPRPVDQEFTQFSFPSKVMEYLASGTPVLTTRLPGMPEEYLEYVDIIDGAGGDAVARALDVALSLPPEELHARGRAGKDYVLEKKNNVVQSGRIVTFAHDC